MSGFTPSGLWDSLPLRFVGGLQQRRVVVNPRVSLCCLTSLIEIFASNAERFARYNMSFSCRCRTLLAFTCSDDFLSVCPARGRLHAFEFLSALLVRHLPSTFTFAAVFCLTWLRASWSAGTLRLRHVCTDPAVYTSGGA